MSTRCSRQTREDAAPADRRGHQLVMKLTPDSGNIACRPQPHRAGDREPGGECARCHARRRPPHHRNRPTSISTRLTSGRTWESQPGDFVMIAVSDTGHRHGLRDAAAHLRAVLHHERARQRYRAGAGHGVWHGEAERRRHLGVQRDGHGTTFKLYFPRVSESRLRQVLQRGSEAGRGSRQARPCCWWKTRRRCAT